MLTRWTKGLLHLLVGGACAALVAWLVFGFSQTVLHTSGPVRVTMAALVVITLLLVGWLLLAPPVRPAEVAAYGTTGGFTTFVANAAGPVLNSYLVGLRLDKHELMGTSAWMYLALNVSKIPFYVALGAWTDGGPFFTGESLLFNLVLVPAIVVGVYAGRALFHRIPQQTFVLVVLALSALGAIRLIV